MGVFRGSRNGRRDYSLTLQDASSAIEAVLRRKKRPKLHDSGKVAYQIHPAPLHYSRIVLNPQRPNLNTNHNPRILRPSTRSRPITDIPHISLHIDKSLIHQPLQRSLRPLNAVETSPSRIITQQLPLSSGSSGYDSCSSRGPCEACSVSGSNPLFHVHAFARQTAK
jgi:hypothetical protein